MVRKYDKNPRQISINIKGGCELFEFHIHFKAHVNENGKINSRNTVQCQPLC